MRKWLKATGDAVNQSSKNTQKEAFANAYLGIVEAAHAAGVDLDDAVAKELEKRGINHDTIEADATERGRKDD